MQSNSCLHFSNTTDIWSWVGDASGYFTVSFIKKMIEEKMFRFNGYNHTFIPGLVGCRRKSRFFYGEQLAINKLPTEEELAKRVMHLCKRHMGLNNHDLLS
ncbi:hypothetical protein HanIR_Chr03g0119881 [Helianthus annuus]|nr:hypothetical protein HanIR_Chr03g0119881 [Helianthus annuus]